MKSGIYQITNKIKLEKELDIKIARKDKEIIIINEIVSFLCILVGYRYKDTKIYNRINKWWI